MQKIILNVDTGIDDALAIAYAALCPDIKLLGIVSSYGMAPVKYTYRNSKKVASLFNENIPVFPGSEKPLKRTRVYGGKIHGMDGLGNILGDPGEVEFPEKDTFEWMNEQVLKYKEELVIVTTGPLTDLAVFMERYPDTMKLVNKVVIMGGAVTTPGNVNKLAEANISIDPEAAKMVFDSNLNITLVGLDVTRKTLLTLKDVERWKEKNTETSLFFASFTEFYLKAYNELHPYLKGCALHDPLAVAVAAYPDLVKTVPMFLTVDLDEGYTGRTTENLHRNSSEKPNTHVSVNVDSSRFMKEFFKYVI